MHSHIFKGICMHTPESECKLCSSSKSPPAFLQIFLCYVRRGDVTSSDASGERDKHLKAKT